MVYYVQHISLNFLCLIYLCRASNFVTQSQKHVLLQIQEMHYKNNPVINFCSWFSKKEMSWNLIKYLFFIREIDKKSELEELHYSWTKHASLALYTDYRDVVVHVVYLRLEESNQEAGVYSYSDFIQFYLIKLKLNMSLQLNDT